MFQWLKLLFMLSEGSPICVVYDSKEFTLKPYVLPLTQTQW